MHCRPINEVDLVAKMAHKQPLSMFFFFIVLLQNGTPVVTLLKE